MGLVTCMNEGGIMECVVVLLFVLSWKTIEVEGSLSVNDLLKSLLNIKFSSILSGSCLALSTEFYFSNSSILLFYYLITFWSSLFISISSAHFKHSWNYYLSYAIVDVVPSNLWSNAISISFTSIVFYYYNFLAINCWWLCAY